MSSEFIRPRRDHKCRSKEAGFSLIEVIVALGILAVGIGTCIALFAAATAAHKRAIDRVHISAIVEQAFADIESALAEGEDPAELEKTPPFQDIERNRPGFQVTPVFYEVPAGDGDELLLEIRIIWTARGVDREEIFSQIIAREVHF